MWQSLTRVLAASVNKCLNSFCTRLATSRKEKLTLLLSAPDCQVDRFELKAFAAEVGALSKAAQCGSGLTPWFGYAATPDPTLPIKGMSASCASSQIARNLPAGMGV